MSLQGLANEIRSARSDALDLHQIRITEHAIPGSIVVVPMTPERQRRLAVPAPSERVVEVLVHPEDWMAMLQVAAGQAEAWDLPVNRPARVLGIPVVVEAHG